MLLRNTGLNLIGFGTPLLVAAVTIPPLLAHLGADRFGFLALIWAVVSYFGLFDLGLGRALTQQLAPRYAMVPRASDTGRILGTGLVLMVCVGLAAALAMVLAAPAVAYIKRLPDQAEAQRAVYWMALAVPAIVLTSGLRGALEARHEFKTVNAIRIPMGVFTYIGPMLIVWWLGPRLDWIAAILALGRLVGCAVHWVFALRSPADRRELQWSRPDVVPLLKTGGWMSVSNVVGPLMANADRFIVAATVSASAVAYYAVPNELVTKLWFIPGALTAVLVPTFATQSAASSPELARVFGLAVRALFVAVLPMTAALGLFAEPFLHWWLGADMASHCALLLQLFAVGMFLNCLASIPYTLLQGAGFARTTALVHCVELPASLLLMWWLTREHGVLGAAVAWLLRMVFDTAAMFFFADRVLPRDGARRWSLADLACAGCAVAWGAGLVLPHGTAVAAVLWLALVAVLATVAARQWWLPRRRSSLQELA